MHRRECRQKKHWISDNTLQLVDQRKQLKLAPNEENQDKIKQLNKEIKAASRRDKNDHIVGVCRELEEHSNKHESRELFNKVR